MHYCMLISLRVWQALRSFDTPRRWDLTHFHVQPGHQAISCQMPFHGRPTPFPVAPVLAGHLLQRAGTCDWIERGNCTPERPAYSSQENAKHTSLAMKENARRGFFNGSRAPFGYQVAATDIPGHKGKSRKRLEVDAMEARVVRQIFDLYVNGRAGQPMGMEAIANHLNQAGLLMRGNPWRIQKLSNLLSDLTYRGELLQHPRFAQGGSASGERVDSLCGRADCR
jgi:hypothetical protein